MHPATATTLTIPATDLNKCPVVRDALLGAYYAVGPRRDVRRFAGVPATIARALLDARVVDPEFCVQADPTARALVEFAERWAPAATLAGFWIRDWRVVLAGVRLDLRRVPTHERALALERMRALAATSRGLERVGQVLSCDWA